MRRFDYLLLAAILFVGLFVRLYRFDAPIADWHSWRQSDTSAVSKNFSELGFDLLHPKYFDISNIQSGKDNPEGYRFVEFPLYNIFQAGGYVLFDFFTIEEWGRLVSIISSILSGLFIFLLVRKYFNTSTALLSVFFLSFLPFSVYYGRSVLPDTMMVMAILGGIYFFDKSLDKLEIRNKFKIQNYIYLLITILFTASALLLKPFAIFFVLPMVYLSYRKFGIAMFGYWQLWILAILSISPLIIWRWWISQYPEGIPSFWWLINGDNIRFKGSYFYWVYGERISKLILGYSGIALLIFGLLKKESEKNYFFFLSFLASAILYMTVIAKGNVQHDYYQILIIPTIAIFLGRGTYTLLSQTDFLNKLIGKAVAIAIILSMFAFSWFHVRGNYVINFSVVKAGLAAQKVIPQNSKVIAPVEGDTTLLNHIGRKGWPAFQRPIEELIGMGALYLVLTNPTENDYRGFGSQYEIVDSSPDYLILKLR